MESIKETKEVIDFGLAVGSGIAQALQDDGKITLADITKFMPAVLALPAAILDVQKVPVELKDLSQEELLEIQNHIMSQAGSIPGLDEKWLQIANGAFKIGAGLLDIFTALKKPVTV